MSKSPSQTIIPSINNIIAEDKTANFNKQVKQLFRPQSYPTFPTKDMVKHSYYGEDQRFHILVQQLQDWNKRVERNQIPKNAKAQLFRNSFLFSSLKKLMVQNSKGSQNYEVNIDKLYEWWQRNSNGPMQIYSSLNKSRKQQDEDWQVRQTFKSNMPLEIKNYERRMMVFNNQDFSRFSSKKQNFTTKQKLIDCSLQQQYKSKQFKQRSFRQQEQFNYSKCLLKKRKAKLAEDSCQNPLFYQGKFDKVAKTITLFNRNQTNELKKIHSYSLLSGHKNKIQEIKKYRIDYVITKKGQLFKERDQNMNKTTISFANSKPFDLTTVDFDQHLSTTQKSTPMRKNSNNFTSFKQQTQNTSQEYIEFNEIKDWDTNNLISNPFENKKALKKKKKP